jgi:Flp pilus assembly pilin Flp
MLNLLARFVREDDGLEMVEIAVVALLVTSAGATAFSTLGVNIQNAIAAVNTILSP